MKTHLSPWTVDLSSYPHTDRDHVIGFCGTLLSVVFGLESVWRQFHPPRLPAIQQALEPFADRLETGRRVFEDAATGFTDNRISGQLLKAAQRTGRCLDYISDIDADRPQTVIMSMLKAMRQHCRAQENLYPLISALKPVGRYFLEEPVRPRVDDFEPSWQLQDDIGLFLDDDGGHCLYVPETYDVQNDWPLVVALHGGGGSGRDFVWAWLREARSRGFLLLAPGAAGRTWSFGELTDATAISKQIDTITERWRVDRRRMLLTGISDGAIYTLTWGLNKTSPFSALAPVSGVLHPADLSSARGKRIYLVHGALDWMFPVSFARQAHAVLQQAGTDIVYREIADLSHTYPREENAAILSWFDPSLSLN